MLETLLALLAFDFTSPTIMLEPDGEICLEWYEAKDRILSVSINGVGRIYYAGILHDGPCHGTANDANVVREMLSKMYG